MDRLLRLETEVVRLTAVAADLERRHRDAVAKVAGLTADRGEKETEVHDLEVRLNAQRGAVDAARAAVTAAEKTHETASGADDKAKAAAELARAKVELARVESGRLHGGRAEELESAFSRRRAELAAIRRELRAAEAARDGLAAELAAVNGQLPPVQNQLAAAEAAAQRTQNFRWAAIIVGGLITAGWITAWFIHWM